MATVKIRIHLTEFNFDSCICYVGISQNKLKLNRMSFVVGVANRCSRGKDRVRKTHLIYSNELGQSEEEND